MNAGDLIKRAERSATLCDEQGFYFTANALRALAEEVQASTRLIDSLQEAHLQQAHMSLPRTQSLS